MCVFEIIYLKEKNNRQVIPNLNEHNYNKRNNKKIDCFGLIKYSIIKYSFKKMGSFGICMYDIGLYNNFILLLVLVCSRNSFERGGVVWKQ